MLKRFLTLSLTILLLFACNVPVGAARADLPLGLGEIRIIDNADLLSEQEEKQIEEYGEQIAQETGLIVLIQTTNSTNGKEIRRYLADAYEDLGYNDSMPSIMLGIDMGNRELAVVTSIVSEEYFPVKKTNAMVDDVTDYLSDGEYQRAAKKFLDEAYETIRNYGVKPVKEIVLISLGAGVVLALIVVAVMVAVHPKLSNNQVSASRYLASKVQMHEHRDQYLRSHTAAVKINTNTGGSSSGGRFSSSSGGHYSGSSGKF